MQYFNLFDRITLAKQEIYEEIYKNHNYSFYITIGLYTNMHTHLLSNIYEYQNKDCGYEYP